MKVSALHPPTACLRKLPINGNLATVAAPAGGGGNTGGIAAEPLLPASSNKAAAEANIATEIVEPTGGATTSATRLAVRNSIQYAPWPS